MKRILTAATLTVLLCGCSHKTEVRDKGFVKAIGCDAADERSAAVRLYGQEDVIEGSGKTFFAAIDNAETAQGKTLFTGHLELLVLSPGDIRDTLSVMIKNNRVSPSCALLMTPDKAAEAVQDSEDLTELLESSSRKGKISKKNISVVLSDLLEEDALAAVPILNDNALTMCVTDGDSISGILSEEESEGFCWLSDTLHDIYVPIEVNGKDVSFHVRKSSTHLSADSDGSSIKITTEIKINGSCIENGISESDASKAISEKVSALCSKTISKTVTGMKADVLGIKKCIDSAGAANDESWNELIPKLQFYYSIKIAS